jgi:hypothetical protein
MVLQYDVLNYEGFLQSALREYHHSGWQMTDYVEEAGKKQFQSKMKMAFKHDAMYEKEGTTSKV